MGIQDAYNLDGPDKQKLVENNYNGKVNTKRFETGIFYNKEVVKQYQTLIHDSEILKKYGM